MRLDGTTQPRRATKLKIGFLSAVEQPAHEGAEALVLKARIIKQEAATVDAEKLMKSVFTEALVENKVEENLCEALWEKVWPVNDALKEAAGKIAKDDMIVDKPAVMRELINEYVLEVSRVLNAVEVFKVEQPTKTEGGVAYPASDFAYVPDPQKPSEWKLRLTSTPGGDPDPAIVGAAAAALGAGFRGQQVDIPDADRAAVVARVRAAWTKANPDKKPEDMPEGIKKEAEMADEKTQAELAKYKALAELSDVQKSHYNALPEAEQPAFLALSAEDRDAVVKTAGAADESFVNVDGVTVTKSTVGAAAYAVMKSQNDQIAKLRYEADMTRLQKQAESVCKHLPGKVDDKARALLAIEKMAATERETVLSMIKAGDAACESGFKPVAAQGGEELSPHDRLEKMADTYAAEHKVTKSAAYAEVMKTEEGRQLYKEAQ